MPTPALVANNRPLQFSQLDRLDQGLGKQIETNAYLANRVDEFLSDVTTWVEQPTGPERAGRLEASRRINRFVQQDTQTIRLNLSNLGLSCLPSNFKLLAQLCRMRGAEPYEQCIQLKGNIFDSETQALLPALQAECQGRLGIGAPPAHPGVVEAVRDDLQNEQYCRSILDVLGAVQTETLPRFAAIYQDTLKFVEFITSHASFSQSHIRYNTRANVMNSGLRQTNMKLRATHMRALKEHTLGSNMEQLAHLDSELKQIQDGLRVAKTSIFKNYKFMCYLRHEKMWNLLKEHNIAKQFCSLLGALSTGLQNLALASSDVEVTLFESEINANRSQLQDKPIHEVLQIALEHLAYADFLVRKFCNAVRPMLQQAAPFLGISVRSSYDHSSPWMPVYNWGYPNWMKGTEENMAALQIQSTLLMSFRKLAYNHTSLPGHELLTTAMTRAVEKLPNDSPYLAALLKHPKIQIRNMVTNREDYKEKPRPYSFWTTLPKVQLKEGFIATSGLQTTAFNAARKGNLKLLLELFEEGVDPQVRDCDGNTLLHAATSVKQNDIIKFLVETQGLDVNATNHHGKTPFLIALEADQLENATCLITLGADPDTPAYPDGRTALLQAVELVDLKKMKFLVKSNANPDAKDLYGRKAIHLTDWTHAAICAGMSEQFAAVRAYCEVVLKQSDLTEGEKLRRVLQSDARCKFQNIVRNREAHMAYWFDQLEFDQMEPKPD